MLAGIRDILIISTERDVPHYDRLLGDGKKLGLNLSYKVQKNPEGLAQAFILGEEFIGKDSVCLILGDNIFYGDGIRETLKKAISHTINNSASIFGYHVNEPSSYGVVEFDKRMQTISIEEKPMSPKSNYAITGIYFYPNDVVNLAKTVKKSSRGELEITSLNQIYLRENRLKVEILGRGFAWLDTGTHDALLEAATFIETIERRQGLKIACIEEISYLLGYISKQELQKLADIYANNQYGKYLITRLEEIV